MKNYVQILTHTQLFADVSDNEIQSMLSCLDGRVRTYSKGDFVFRQGEYIEKIMILVDGKLHIRCDDYWGNSNLIRAVEVGEMFGEAYATPNSSALLNSVIAVEESTIMFFDVRKILTTCSNACRFHALIVQNLFYAISDQNRQLVQKLGHMVARSTRQKLISYLSEESARHNASTFEIPFNRQQLADYLSVDRSAMSNELSKMQKDGLIQFERNRFTLISKTV